MKRTAWPECFSSRAQLEGSVFVQGFESHFFKAKCHVGVKADYWFWSKNDLILAGLIKGKQTKLE